MDLFDGFDEHLERGPLRYAVKWAEAGMDVAFDEYSRRDYANASVSDDAFDYFLEGRRSRHALLHQASERARINVAPVASPRHRQLEYSGKERRSHESLHRKEFVVVGIALCAARASG